MSRTVPVVDLPLTTGNGAAVVSGNVVLLDRELRDSTGARWYWHVRLHGSGTIRLRMARPDLVGGFGPCIRRPSNAEYDWLCDSYAVREDFLIELGRSPCTVLLAATLPYGPAQWASFVRRIGCDRFQRVRIGASEQGRPVELIRVPAVDSPKCRVVLSARHHACEALGSRLLEAMVASFLALRDAGVVWARRTELLAVPFVDIDGVVNGDSGKGRLPHDHNRDYGPVARYAAVRAIRGAGLFASAPTVVLDLHTPGLLGPLEERPFLVASGDRGDAEMVTAFADAVGGGPAASPEVMIFDEDWNSVHTSGPRCFAAWARSHRHIVLGASVEYPNAVVRGVPVSSAAVRHFGERLIVALGQVLDQ